jgi:hypothetical protein
MTSKIELIERDLLDGVSGGNGLRGAGGAATQGLSRLPAAQAVSRLPTPAFSRPAGPALGPKAEGQVQPVGRQFPNAFRAYGPDGAFSYFRVIDGVVHPGLF